MCLGLDALNVSELPCCNKGGDTHTQAPLSNPCTRNVVNVHTLVLTSTVWSRHVGPGFLWQRLHVCCGRDPLSDTSRAAGGGFLSRPRAPHHISRSFPRTIPAGNEDIPGLSAPICAQLGPSKYSSQVGWLPTKTVNCKSQLRNMVEGNGTIWRRNEGRNTCDWRADEISCGIGQFQARVPHCMGSVRGPKHRLLPLIVLTSFHISSCRVHVTRQPTHV